MSHEGLQVAPLDPARHDRAAFRCGVPVLDNYLQRVARQDGARGYASVYVLTAGDAEIRGYYSISAVAVELAELPAHTVRKLPRYPDVPCFRLGRLAVALTHQRKGYGELLLGDAVRLAIETADAISAYALVVDAKDDTAADFYERYGFKPFDDSRRSLFLPLHEARANFA